MYYSSGISPVRSLVEELSADEWLYVLCVASFVLQLSKKPRGNDEMNKLSDLIQKSARSFLITEYKSLAVFGGFVFAAFVLLFTLIESREDRTDGTPRLSQRRFHVHKGRS